HAKLVKTRNPGPYLASKKIVIVCLLGTARFMN
ncbi:hypothetical protein BMETH_22133444431404, partial [methanotrophic bacterial endosymbiont of Bathymodiolus sp.]